MGNYARGRAGDLRTPPWPRRAPRPTLTWMTRADPTSPLFSVVMCVRDGEAHLPDALASLQSQTHRSFEVVAVDDGSTDATPAILDDAPEVTTRLAVDGAGIAVARNTALGVARGRYITFLDHDDLYHPSRLERIAAWLAAHSFPPAVYTGLTVFTEVDEVPGGALWARQDDIWPRYTIATGAVCETVRSLPVPGSDDNAVRLDLRGDDGLVSAAPGPALVVRRELLVAAGGSPVSFQRASDYAMMSNVARLEPIVQIEQPSYFYRVRADSVTRRGGAHWPYLAAVLSRRLGGMDMDLQRAVGRGAPLPRDLVFEDLLAAEIERGLAPGELPLLAHTLAVVYPRWRDRLPLVRRLLRDAVQRRTPRLASAVVRAKAGR